MPKETLRDYRAKRDFSRTAEPAGGEAGAGSRFVVHKHQATADHYDLRLELGGVLKSWAVPKGPSLDPADRRLAIQTEDHPVEYIDFEAVIPEGEYGGGPMIVWDTGTWAPMGDADAGLKAGELKFRLAGEKLGGGWMLVRLKPKPGEKKAVWLLIKEKDAAAAPGRDILAERPESVKSGRRIEELAPAAPVKVGRLRPGSLAGAVKGPGPERLAPQLASPVERPPEGGDWLHEIKLDGYRTLALRDGEAVRLITRGGLDWTHRYGDLAEAFRGLPCREAVVDGEIVVLDEGGVSRFALLQDALSRGARNELVFFAFDLVRLDGWNLAGVPLVKRKGLLRQLLAGATGRSAIQFSDHVEGGGAGFYEQVSRMGLEGVVSKRGSAVYQPGRSKTWVKCKAKLYGDFVIVGYTASAAAGGLGALALGEWVDGELVYRGKVGTGFDAATLADLLARLRPLEDRELAIAGAPKDVRWVRPVMSVKVEYSNLTSDGSVRHGVFKGLREVAAIGAGGGAEAAGVGGGPREHLGDQPDAAAVRAGGADEARRGGLLCRGRGLHAAASLRAAGEPGQVPDGEAGGLLLPAAPVPGDAGGGGELRDADERRGGPDVSDGGRRRRGTWRWRSSGWSSSTPGGARWSGWSGRTGWCFDLDPGRGDRLAGGGGGGGACAGGTGSGAGSSASPRRRAARGCTWWCR